MAVLVPPVGIGNSNAYFFPAMKFEFCIPTRGTSVPSGSDWLHEVKYDGYRLRLERDGDRVRLFTRGGYNWTDRYPWIVEAARKVRQKRFVLDGEAVVLGVDGVSPTSTHCTAASISASATTRRCCCAAMPSGRGPRPPMRPCRMPSRLWRPASSGPDRGLGANCGARARLVRGCPWLFLIFQQLSD